ncbi:N-ethylmaleimide reductase [Penicillium subrubescens]|uniref:N-ethylmaleimide reductase n=1 Tax=Penicillium subrubescens TaxID=1316194 RepID=UPI002545721F|nr:N-ethylmaleimide reductase [Penicillium subrubescens]KAJ5880751.1 N-ethylmaleimide reductase [Penicillium subrubescens]
MVGPQKPGIGDQYHFITIHDPHDRTASRLARSYAVARGLENKRKAQSKLGDNFRIVSPKNDSERPIKRRESEQTLVNQPGIPCSAPPSFFHWLAAESPKLNELLNRDDVEITTPAGNAVLSVLDELVLQNFRPILRTGPDDDVLLNAIMLTFSFSIAAGHLNRQCLEYQSAALSSVRKRINSPNKSTMESTMGAILLLAGVEAQKGVPRQVRLHMGAIYQLLEICQRKGVYLSDGIKRAIFWSSRSDLNSAVIAGSSRVFDHTTFSELQWRRDPLSPKFFTLPPGFQPLSHLLDESFSEILKDIHALQCIRDSALFGAVDVISMAHIDNHQASIQSRLIDLPDGSPISDCCHIAAYLCSTMLRCKVWRTSTIPSHLSLQLLSKLQKAKEDPTWNNLRELLIWLLHIGGAFAPTGSIRTAYKKLLHLSLSTRLAGLYTSWAELCAILRQFIWSDKAFMSQIRAFWEECIVEYRLEQTSRTPEG